LEAADARLRHGDSTRAFLRVARSAGERQGIREVPA
jgi:hypothetical protein